ncbi:MAG TPA: GspH/FimT family pseudopilin [Xylella sp.]
MSPSRGYTLPELLITMVLLTLLTSVGLPFFKRTVERQRVENAMYMLSSHLAGARIAAITQKIPVSVCPSHGNSQCRQDSNWSTGWISYSDWNRRSQPTSPEAIFQKQQISNTDAIRIVSTSRRPRVRFLPDGRSTGSNISISFCNRDRLIGLITVNNSGRIRSNKVLHPKACSDNPDIQHN